MPQAPTANMALVQPTEGGDSGTWDTILTTLFGLVDAHDHTSGKGVRVPSSGLNINADVAAGTNSITGLKAVDFTAVATTAVSSYAGALFLNSADNELYYRTTGGSNVQLTSGTSLNVAAFVGGIGGDYVSASALVSYDDATDSYWFQQQGSPRPWARMRSGDVDIYETAPSITNRVRLQSPAALAASYALTFPAALPGAASILQVSSAGVISASNTVANATIRGANLQYTTQQNLWIPVAAYKDNTTAVHGYNPSTSPGAITLAASTAVIAIPVELREGDTIQEASLYVNKASDATNTLSFRLRRVSTAGAYTTISTATNSANAPGNVAITTGSIAHAIVAGNSYFFEVWQSDSSPSAADTIYATVVAVTRD